MSFDGTKRFCSSQQSVACWHNPQICFSLPAVHHHWVNSLFCACAFFLNFRKPPRTAQACRVLERSRQKLSQPSVIKACKQSKLFPRTKTSARGLFWWSFCETTVESSVAVLCFCHLWASTTVPVSGETSNAKSSTLLMQQVLGKKLPCRSFEAQEAHLHHQSTNALTVSSGSIRHHCQMTSLNIHG